MSYLNSQEAKNILTQEMTSIIQSTNIETQISQIMSQYMQSSMQNLSSSLQEVFKKYDVYEFFNGKCFSI